MKNNKQINDKDLKDISGGNSLEQLLSELGEKDKKKHVGRLWRWK